MHKNLWWQDCDFKLKQKIYIYNFTKDKTVNILNLELNEINKSNFKFLNISLIIIEERITETAQNNTGHIKTLLTNQ